MGGLRAALWIALALVVMCDVQCNEDIESMISRLDDLNEDVIRVEERVVKQIDLAKISLRSELKKHISEHVREAIAGILQGESIEEMVRSQVITEVRQLRRGNQQIKRQLHRVLMSVQDVQAEMNSYKKAMKKATRDASDFQVCSKYIIESEILKRDLDLGERNNEECRKHKDQRDKIIIEMKQNLKTLNQTYQLQLGQFDLNTSTAKTQVITSSESTTTSTPLATSTVTTIKPEGKKSRIIVAPFWSGAQHQFRQLDIHSNTVCTYQLRRLKYVISIAYVSKFRKLLIGLDNPSKIISSSLDSDDVKTIRENVASYGMAIDEERETVFMTTYSPYKTISRITTQGKSFTVITDMSTYAEGGWLNEIAVNTGEKIIYACIRNKVMMMTYDGRGLQTLATGSRMYALTLDSTGSILYFNDNKKLMRMSLSHNVSEIVTTLNVTPLNIRYHNNTVYFSSCSLYPGKIGAVDVLRNNVSFNLQTLSLTGVSYYGICLV